MNEQYNIELASIICLGFILIVATLIIVFSVLYDVTTKKSKTKNKKRNSIKDISQLELKFEKISGNVIKKSVAFILGKPMSKIKFNNIPGVLLGYLSLPLIILVTLIQAYSMLTAATLQTNSLLIVGMFAVILWILISTWYHSNESRQDKMILTLSAPFMYFIVFTRLLSIIYKRIVAADSL